MCFVCAHIYLTRLDLFENCNTVTVYTNFRSNKNLFMFASIFPQFSPTAMKLSMCIVQSTMFMWHHKVTLLHESNCIRNIQRFNELCLFRLFSKKCLLCEKNSNWISARRRLKHLTFDLIQSRHSHIKQLVNKLCQSSLVSAWNIYLLDKYYNSKNSHSMEFPKGKKLFNEKSNNHVA